jgi:hypothetical protein
MGPTEYQNAERAREVERAREAERVRETRDRPTVERPAAQTERTVSTVTPEPLGAVTRTAPYTAVDDRVRWGPVWAGVLTAFSIFLVLEFLGIGLGLISPVNGNAGATSGISTLIAGLIAFFIGGWVAESASAARGMGARLLSGFLVWTLVTTLIMALSIVGLGTLFGALGALAGQVAAAGHSLNVGSVNGAQVGSATRLAGWGAFIWLVISALAAIAGSMIGLPRRAVAWRHA